MRSSVDCPWPTRSDRLSSRLAGSPLMPSLSAIRARISTRILPSGTILPAGSPRSTPRLEQRRPRQLRAEVPASLARVQRHLRQTGYGFPSTKAGLFQPLEKMFARLLRAELGCEPLGVEERRQTRNDGALAFGILVSAHLRVARREDRMSHELSVSSGAPREGAARCLDGLAVAVEEIIRHANKQSCPGVGPVEAERSFDPGKSLGGSARKNQDISPHLIAVCIVWINFERMVDLAQCEIIMFSAHTDNGEQAVGAGCRGVERQSLLRQRLGALDLFIAKFRPSGHDGVEICPAKRRIGGGIIQVEVDRALEHLPRRVVLLARRIDKALTAAQDVFIGGEAAGWLGENALLLESGELDCCDADNTPGNVVLHGENVLGLSVVGFGPEVAASLGLGQSRGHANPVVGAPDAAVEEIAGIEQPSNLGR